MGTKTNKQKQKKPTETKNACKVDEMKDWKTHPSSKRSCLFHRKGIKSKTFWLRKFKKGLVFKMSSSTNLDNICSENMDLQNVLPADIICQGRMLFSRERTAFSTATTDLEDKYYIRVIIPEKQLSQNDAGCLCPL